MVTRLHQRHLARFGWSLTICSHRAATWHHQHQWWYCTAVDELRSTFNTARKLLFVVARQKLPAIFLPAVTANFKLCDRYLQIWPKQINDTQNWMPPKVKTKIQRNLIIRQVLPKITPIKNQLFVCRETQYWHDIASTKLVRVWSTPSVISGSSRMMKKLQGEWLVRSMLWCHWLDDKKSNQPIATLLQKFVLFWHRWRKRTKFV